MAVLPALALILYGAGEQRINDTREAKRDALRLVRVIGASQQRLVESAHHLLVALSVLREVRAKDGAACSALLANLLKEYPLYLNLGAADVKGVQYCSALPKHGQVNLGDRSYFRLAVESKKLAVGKYQIGRVTGKPSLNLGYPVFNAEGSVIGVVFAAIELAPLKQVTGVVNLPSYAALAVYDRNGTLLARTPDTESLVGQSVLQADIVKAAIAQGEGVAETTGFDGKKRLYGFTSIGDGSAEGQIFLHVGIPMEVALADADWLLKRNLAALLLVAVLALAAAWYGGDFFVLRPLRTLLRTTERLASGDLAARTGLPHDVNEIGRLAASFDRMAGSLEAQCTEATAAGHRLERNFDRLQALRRIEMAITSTLDLRSMLNLMLEQVDLVLPGAVATIRLINKKTGELEPAACRNIDEAEWRASRPRPMNGFAKVVLESKSPLTVTNVQTDPRSDNHRFGKRLGLASYLGIPLMVKGEVLGLVAFFTKTQHSFSDEEIEFVTTVAHQSAIAIHNAMLYDETRRSAEELSALHSLTIAATRSLNLTEILQAAIQKITDVFHFDATRIFLFDAEMTALRVSAVYEAEPALWVNVSSFERGQGVVGRAADTGESFIFEDINRDPRYAEISHTKVHKSAGTDFLAVFPISTKLKTWGVAVFVGKQARRLEPDEIRLLSSMTNQMGIAVENATLYLQTAAKAKELYALYSIAGIASESLEINIILRRTMEKVLEILGFDAARIYLRKDASGDLHLVAHQGLPDGVPLVSTYKAGEGQLGRAVETGKAIFVENMMTDPAFNELAHNKYLLKAGFHSSFLIPLKVRGEGLGVMHFLGKNPHRFSETDTQLINAIAYHLGVAVGNARLFSELQKKTVELEKSSQGKDEFLGVISHELRTPLNVIKGYTEIMMQGILGEITDEQRKGLETISNQAMELFQMISGVLQVTKIEAGALQAATSEVNMVNLLEELRRNYSIPFGKDLQVAWEYPSDLPRLMTDEEKLKAIIQNLVNNAIKFTEKGVVAVSVRQIVAANEIELRIADSGIGIPKEKIRTIFDMFQQVDSSATRKFGGVGLGLYIVRKYTDLLGGRIAVESEFERGSIFTVCLPIVRAAANAASDDRELSQFADRAAPPIPEVNGL